MMASKNVIFIRISRRAKNLIGHSRTANAILQRLIRLHDNDADRRMSLVNDPRLRECEKIAMEDGRSRLLIDRGLRYQALAYVFGQSRLLKALLVLVVLHYMHEFSKRIKGRFLWYPLRI